MLITLILKVIENPDSKNDYVKLRNYYQEHNKISEVHALDNLIQQKFHANNSPNH